jgi:hypothetical protein
MTMLIALFVIFRKAPNSDAFCSAFPDQLSTRKTEYIKQLGEVTLTRKILDYLSYVTVFSLKAKL